MAVLAEYACAIFLIQILHALFDSMFGELDVRANLLVSCSRYQLPIISTQLTGLASLRGRLPLRSELLRLVVWLLLGSVNGALPSAPKGVGVSANQILLLTLGFENFRFAITGKILRRLLTRDRSPPIRPLAGLVVAVANDIWRIFPIGVGFTPFG